MTKPELEQHLVELCRKWQRILRLQDWDIKVQVVYNLVSSQAEVVYRLPKRMAVVKVLHPDAYEEKDFLWPQDMEKSLVHELLHLHLAAWRADDGTLEGAVKEQAIDAIASALVESDRRETHAGNLVFVPNLQSVRSC